MVRKSRAARAPKLSAVPFAIRPRASSISAMTSIENARTVPPKRAVWGMTLYASPACSLVTDTTAVSVGGTLRDTTDWIAPTMCAATTTGSTLDSGRAPCAPTPSISNVEERPAGHHRPDLTANLPTGNRGRLWMPKIASHGNCSNRGPSSIIAWAPPSPSSAGWKMKNTCPSKSRVSAR